MLKKIILGISILVITFLFYAYKRPDAFKVERKIEIKATPEQIFPFVNNLQNWNKWSPWDKLDPDMKRTYSGEQSGIGAKYEWKGNKEVGSGNMEILESVPFSKISFQIHFIEPFEDMSATEFIFEPNGENTTVSWTMYGRYNFMSKIMCIFVSMDGMIGKDFESGLKNLKSALEAN